MHDLLFVCFSGLVSASSGLHLTVCALSEFELLIRCSINIPVYTPQSRDREMTEDAASTVSFSST